MFINIIFYLFVTNADALSNFVEILKNDRAPFVTIFTCTKPSLNLQDLKTINNFYIRSRIVQDMQDQTYKLDVQLKENFVLDISCNQSAFILKWAQENLLFRFANKWIIFDAKFETVNTTASLKTYFDKIQLRMDSDVRLILPNQSVYDVYNPGRGRSGGTIFTAIDNICSQLDNGKSRKNHVSSKFEQRKNMSQVFIRAAIIHLRTITTTLEDYYTSTKDRHVDTINKLSYAVFMNLKHMFQFQLKLLPVDRWFGDNRIIDGGIAKELYEGHVDAAGSAGAIKKGRVPLLGYLAPTYPFRSSFVYRNPRNMKVDNQFLKPFTASTWICTLICFLTASILFKIASIYDRKFGVTRDEVSLSWTIFFGWAFVCQQGVSNIPKPTSNRLIILCMLALTMILYNFYTSAVISSLLKKAPPVFPTIRSLTYSDMEVGAERTPYIPTLFEVYNTSYTRYLYKRICPPNAAPAFFTIPEGAAKIRSGHFAFHVETSTLYPWIERMFDDNEICDLEEVDFWTTEWLYLFIPKNGEYHQLFIIGLRMMGERGIMARERNVWIAKKPPCQAGITVVAVGIHLVSAAFTFLGGGILISLVVYCIELMYKRFLQTQSLRAINVIRYLRNKSLL